MDVAKRTIVYGKAKGFETYCNTATRCEVHYILNSHNCSCKLHNTIVYITNHMQITFDHTSRSNLVHRVGVETNAVEVHRHVKRCKQVICC